MQRSANTIDSLRSSTLRVERTPDGQFKAINVSFPAVEPAIAASERAALDALRVSTERFIAEQDLLTPPLRT